MYYIMYLFFIFKYDPISDFNIMYIIIFILQGSAKKNIFIIDIVPEHVNFRLLNSGIVNTSHVK